jgi:hypothetical protein
MSGEVRIGRFSDGQQSMPDAPEHLRIGRFSDGISTSEGPDTWRVGRFSTGHEALAESDQHVRIGSFSDTEAPRRSLTLHRTAPVAEDLETESASS